MDVAAIGGEDYDHDGIYSIGFKGEGKDKRGKGKGEYYNCGATGHLSRMPPQPYKGKGKRFLGECYNCGEV